MDSPGKPGASKESLVHCATPNNQKIGLSLEGRKDFRSGQR